VANFKKLHCKLYLQLHGAKFDSFDVRGTLEYFASSKGCLKGYNLVKTLVT